MTRRPSPTPLLCALAAIALAPIARAQTAPDPDPDPEPDTPTTVREPPELVQFREKFETELTQRLAPAKDAYASKLENLELKRALVEDYAGALRAQSKRLAVTGGAGGGGRAADPIEGELTVPLNRGRRNGNSIRYDSKRAALTGFSIPDQYITWDIMKVTPGLYDVLFTYGCAEKGSETVTDSSGSNSPVSIPTGGSFTFEEDTNLGTGEDRLLRHTVYSTGGWDKMVTRNIGQLRLTGTTSTLKLTTLEPHPGGLMALRRIRLLPAAAGNSLSDASGTGALAKLRARYSEKVTEVVGSEFENYIADLKALEEKLATADRIREALSVKAARNAIEAQMQDIGAATKTLTAPR